MLARSHHEGGPGRRGLAARHTLSKRAGFSRRPQEGAVGVMFVGALIVIIGFCALAIDLSLRYNRKAELQTVADAAALAAAKELVGTTQGIDKAVTEAGVAAGRLQYEYTKYVPDKYVTWSADAIQFGSSPSRDGEWMDASAAKSKADQIFYVKVDTSKLDPKHGFVESIFIQVLSPAAANDGVSATAVAGRSDLSVTPLAICAMDNTPAKARANPGPPALQELVEYGFRRGVAYDLMQLNSNGSTAEHFVVNPVDRPGFLGMQANSDTSAVAPFVCTGTIRLTGIVGASITVRRPFPINDLANHLNSRFGQYPGDVCSPATAPADTNIRPYPYTSISWMSSVAGDAPGGQRAAEKVIAGSKLWTVADEDPGTPGITAPMYGPLWSYGRAVPFSAYTAGVAEPGSGYTTFTTSAWPTLYPPVTIPTQVYPATTPYRATAGTNYLAPTGAYYPGVRDRRILNVPLLQCPVAPGVNVNATVLAIGKFFMTVPATSSTLIAEFGGVVPESQLAKSVELF